MTSITEGATENSNKRRRTDTEEDGATNVPTTTTTIAAASTFIATSTTHPPDSIVTGTRLEPVASILALQPEELKGTLISRLNEMLDLRATIKQRASTHKSRYDKPSRRQATGAQSTDVPDDPPFIPGFLRTKNPLSASDQMNDHPQMKELIAESYIEYTEWLHKAAKWAEKVSTLEITLRQDELRVKLYIILDKMSLAHTIEEKYDNDGFDEGMKLSQDEIVVKAAHDSLLELSKDDAAVFGVEDGEAMAKEYAAKRSYNDAATALKMDSVCFTDKDFITEVKKKLVEYLPKLTVNLWRTEDAKEKKRRARAELKEALIKQETLSATQAVEEAMETEDSNQVPQGLQDAINKATAKAVGKEVQRVKKSLKKNSSGGDKTKPPKPTKNGPESRKGSDTSSKKSKKTSTAGGDKSRRRNGDSKDKSHPESSILKNGKKVTLDKKAKRHAKEDASKESTSKRRGNRGGAKGGARGKSS